MPAPPARRICRSQRRKGCRKRNSLRRLPPVQRAYRNQARALVGDLWLARRTSNRRQLRRQRRQRTGRVAAAFAAAAGYFTSTFANPITITLDVGWGEIAGQPLSSGALGESESYLLEESYQQLTAALAGDTSSPIK